MPIKLDPNNARLHTDLNKEQIKKSLEELGAGRSVLTDKDDVLIAGNGVFEQAKELGIPIRQIDTDGSELIVVKRTDLSYKDEDRRRLAIADNAIGETSEWDFEELTDDEIAEFSIEKPYEFNDPDINSSFEDHDKEGVEDSYMIKLNYTEEEYQIVTAALDKIGGSREAAIYKLLNDRSIQG